MYHVLRYFSVDLIISEVSSKSYSTHTADMGRKDTESPAHPPAHQVMRASAKSSGGYTPEANEFVPFKTTSSTGNISSNH